jgi:hypothetical protein
MRRADLYLGFLLTLLILFGLMLAHAGSKVKGEAPRLLKTENLVRTLELTDLCLFTEASYTRHLSQTDFHTPFQDYPMSLEHFPSGSLFGPSATGNRPHAKMD